MMTMQTMNHIEQDRSASTGVRLTELVDHPICRPECGGISDPLDELLTLAAVLHDLFGLPGEPIPEAIASRMID